MNFNVQHRFSKRIWLEKLTICDAIWNQHHYLQILVERVTLLLLGPTATRILEYCWKYSCSGVLSRFYIRTVYNIKFKGLKKARIKNIGSARYAHERETHEGKGRPAQEAHQNRFPPNPSNCTRDRNLHMSTKVQLICQLNVFCRGTIYVFYYSTCSKLCADS